MSRNRNIGAGQIDATSDEWLVWQLVDSAFPIGGFAHSCGLEAAWQHGEIRTRDDLMNFVEAALQQLGHASLPFVAAAFAAPEQLAEFDSLCEAFLSNHVANRASRAQGRAFLVAVERLGVARNVNQPTENPSSHFAPVFGACLRKLALPRRAALRMFVFHHLRGIFSAAVRLNIIGPMEAQSLQRRVSPAAEKLVQESEFRSIDDMAQTAPLLDIWQGAQDRLYSRLFQS